MDHLFHPHHYAPLFAALPFIPVLAWQVKQFFADKFTTKGGSR